MVEFPFMTGIVFGIVVGIIIMAVVWRKKFAELPPDRKRLIIMCLLITFFMSFILINVVFQTGMIYTILSIMSIAIIVSWDVIPKKRTGEEAKLMGVTKNWWKALFWGGAIAGIFILISFIFPGFDLAIPSTPLATTSETLVVVGAAPLVEEVVFRSILFSILFAVVGLSFITSLLVSSGAFAIYHIWAYAREISLSGVMSMSGSFLAAAVFGGIFMLLVWFFKDVTAGVGGHAVINAAKLNEMLGLIQF